MPIYECPDCGSPLLHGDCVRCDFPLATAKQASPVMTVGVPAEPAVLPVVVAAPARELAPA